MKILVTGGFGFLGSNLIRKLLMQGHEVTVIDDLSTGSQPNNKEIYFYEMPVENPSCDKVFEILLPGVGNVADDLRERHRRPAAEQEHPVRAAERIDSAAADDRNARRDADDGQDIGGPAAQSEEHAAQKFAENARAGHEQIGRKQYARRDADDAAGFALLPLLLKIRGARCGG